MSNAYEYLKRLSRYPHRGTATPLEAAAAKEMAGWLREMGYSVSLQPFRAPRDTLYLGPSVVMLGFILGAALGRWVPWAGIAVSLLFLAPMVGELLGSSRLDFDWLLPTYPSQNLVARKAPAGNPGRTLVMTAHYDTQRASLLFHPRVAQHLQGYFTCVYVLLAAVPVLLLLRWMGASWTAPALLAVGGLLAINVLFLAVCWRTGRYINGANDNGSGVALALALAERFAAVPLPDTDLIVVLTGAEEVGTRGMKAFVANCGLDPRRTCFVNLDNIGGGHLHYLLGEGMLAFRPYSPDLVALARQIGDEFGGDRLRSKKNLLLPTDGSVPSLAGYPAISFLAFQEDGSLPNYHWYTDTLDRVDPALLAFAEEFLTEYLQRMWGEVAVRVAQPR